MVDTFEPPKYIGSLITAINDGAKSAQTGAFAFALIGIYLLATAFSATDEDLLLDRTLAISQLGAQIPVTVSFAMMPILFVALHVFTLIRYDMLAANVNQFRADLETMVPAVVNRERCRQLLANVEFIQELTAPAGSALHSRLFGFVAWVMIAGFPVIVLLAVQTNALRYQSEIVTNVQRVSLLADLAVLIWFYNRRRRQWVSNPDAYGVALRRWALCLWTPVIIATVDLVWLNIPGPSTTTVQLTNISTGWKKWEAVADGFAIQPLDLFLCPELKWGCRFLRVSHRPLVGKVWDSKAIVELGAGQPLTEERRASFEGAFLRERTLRFADLSESLLYAADLRGANLTNANLSSANLTGVKLMNANLINANLGGANLNGGANLFGADLSGANLIHANLSGANLIGAHLIGAKLMGADLSSADLSGANLSGGADLGYAHLIKVTLRSANLIGASLASADLNGGNLTDANLSDANLSDADLVGSNFTRADLTRANLFGTEVKQSQLDDACGEDAKLPPGLTLKPCPKAN
jgi:uncharacterized protein YjbI with pentapeptide repeats